jgi:hypothetical protein
LLAGGCGGARIFPRQVAQVGVCCVCGERILSNSAKRTHLCTGIGGCFASGPEYGEKSALGGGGRGKWLEGEGRKSGKNSDPPSCMRYENTSRTGSADASAR